jgi:hypothetical protein
MSGRIICRHCGCLAQEQFSHSSQGIRAVHCSKCNIVYPELTGEPIPLPKEVMHQWEQVKGAVNKMKLL